MLSNHITPFFENCQAGAFTEGFEFSHEGVRFCVVGVMPEKGYGVAGKNTTIFFEGDAIERDVLKSLNVVPFEDGLPDRYRPTKMSLAEDAIKRDFTLPYFTQRSAPVKVAEMLEIEGLKFKVVSCTPSAGGGFGRDTELQCKGVALKMAFEKTAAKSKAAVKAKAKPK